MYTKYFFYCFGLIVLLNEFLWHRLIQTIYKITQIFFRKIKKLKNWFSWLFHFLFRCQPEDLSFSPFAAAAAASATGQTSFPSMPYLKTSPYLMTVDTLHSMGYQTNGKKVFINSILNKIFSIVLILFKTNKKTRTCSDTIKIYEN